MTLFTSVARAPSDPVFGLNEQFAADPRPNKVNLGIGVYADENGKLPLLRCVQSAEEALAKHLAPRAYLPMDGLRHYDAEVQKLLFGADSEPVTSARVVTLQALGGTGALRLAADFLKKMGLASKALISDPSWANHRALFAGAGFDVARYSYSSQQAHGVDFDGMLADLGAADTGTVVVLHACCHNPTGYDLDDGQWDRVVEVVRQRGLIPVLDLAYQGFGRGLSQDRAALDKFVRAGVNFLVANSFSKNFSLYGERVGALSVVCSNAEEAARVLSQLKITVRTNYSNPPTHGAAVVTHILRDPELHAFWEQELTEMRERIRTMRQQLVDGLAAAGVKQDMRFMLEQLGMFSYSGLSKEQMQQLRSAHGVYGLDSGRLCVAALNAHNIAYVCDAIAQVLSTQQPASP